MLLRLPYVFSKFLSWRFLKAIKKFCFLVGPRYLCYSYSLLSDLESQEEQSRHASFLEKGPFTKICRQKVKFFDIFYNKSVASKHISYRKNSFRYLQPFKFRDIRENSQNYKSYWSKVLIDITKGYEIQDRMYIFTHPLYS